ncbi:MULTISPECIES: hypothetical protein [Bacillus cereus group]|uniref:Uncharacterized protein n=1 Tax=Bacillus thuringiensis TaxID=1428 RepID=A0A9X7AS98_BACTU|nr:MULTISPECIES: hypothetical protein [Bacillus cereus group]PFT50896.1 hypothetical protein COK72_02485 [Bacillus thuringiensis]PFY22933.1 hypothetical protein COL44_18805 [Bacillus toyonensis]HDR4373437.1 hypothetical protein [Bacillus cereus]
MKNSEIPEIKLVDGRLGLPVDLIKEIELVDEIIEGEQYNVLITLKSSKKLLVFFVEEELEKFIKTLPKILELIKDDEEYLP